MLEKKEGMQIFKNIKRILISNLFFVFVPEKGKFANFKKIILKVPAAKSPIFFN